MTVQGFRAAASAGDNLVTMDDKGRPVEYLDMNGVGKWFGVSGATVAVWRHRYAESHPIPVADVIVGRHLGWTREREPEWRAWHASRDGQGSGGGPKPRRSSGEAPKR